MDAREANVLLTRAGLVDGRKPSVERAEVWAEVLVDLPFQDGYDALTEYHRRSSGWVMPADLITIARELKARAADEARRLEARQARPTEKPAPLTIDDKATANQAYRQGLLESRARRGDDRPLEDTDTLYPEAPVVGPSRPGVSSAHDFSEQRTG